MENQATYYHERRNGMQDRDHRIEHKNHDFARHTSRVGFAQTFLQRHSLEWLGWLVAANVWVLVTGITACETHAWDDNEVVKNGREGAREDFLGQSKFECQRLFSDQRFPNITVAADGTVVAAWGHQHIRSRRSLDGGQTWEEAVDIRLKDSIHGGGLLADTERGDLWLFVETAHPPAEQCLYRSVDSGASWVQSEFQTRPNSLGHTASWHMNESGLTLQRGSHAGRLLRAARYYGEGNRSEFWPTHYTNAVFSDDGGKTWESSEPFPALGTGEATIIERRDGTLYYNSRRHWAAEGENPRRRWSATSRDGGRTWTDLKFIAALPDGPQDTNYGLMAGLVRLPIEGEDILVFSNVDSPAGRKNGTVWVSFDGGETWPLKRVISAGPFAYSSLAAGRPGTASQGWIYLFYEGGPVGSEGDAAEEDKVPAQAGGSVARFNLSWLLEGESTGDGQIPARFRR